MRELLHQFMNRRISRRSFGKGLAALGLSAAAVESVVHDLALAQQPPPAEGVPFTGTGAEVLVETLRAAGVRRVFGTSATGMSAFFDAITVPVPSAKVLTDTVILAPGTKFDRYS